MTQSFFSITPVSTFNVVGLTSPVTHMLFVKYAKYSRVIVALKSGKVGFFSFPENPTSTSTKVVELPDGHNGPVTTILNCGSEERPKEEGWQIFTGGVDGTVRLWVLWGDNIYGADPRTEHGAEVQVLRGHRGSVTSLAILGSLEEGAGARLFSGSIDGTIIEWQRSKNAVGLRFPSFHSTRIFRFFEPSTSWPCSLLAVSDSEVLVGDSTGTLHALDVVSVGSDLPQSPTSNASAISVSGKLRRLAKDHALALESLAVFSVPGAAGRVLVSLCNEGVANFYGLRGSELGGLKLTVKSAGHERYAGALQVIQLGASGSQVLFLVDKFDARVAAAVELGGVDEDVRVRVLQQKLGDVSGGIEGLGWNFCGARRGLVAGFPGSDESLGLILAANASGTLQFHSVRSEMSLPSLCEASEATPVVWLGVMESTASGCLSSCLLAAHESGTLVFWDLEGASQKPVAMMRPGKSSRVASLTSASLLPDLSCVLTGHDDGAILQWPLTRSFDVRNRSLEPKSHSDSVTGFVRFGEVIVSLGIGGRANFWRPSVSHDSFTRENLQPVPVDSSGLLCGVVWRGACLVGSMAGKVFSLQGLGGNFEQVKAVQCSWWQSESGASVVAMRCVGEDLFVLDGLRQGYILNSEAQVVKQLGKLDIRANFSFSPLDVLASGRIYVACSDGQAKVADVTGEESKLRVIGEVGFGLSAVVVHGDRAFYGAENGRVVVVEADN